MPRASTDFPLQVSEKTPCSITAPHASCLHGKPRGASKQVSTEGRGKGSSDSGTCMSYAM